MANALRRANRPRSAFQDGLEKAFDEALPTLPGSAWMQQLRKEALARVLRDGLPHKRVEWWKYTDLAAALDQSLTVSATQQRAPSHKSRLFENAGFTEIELERGKILRRPQSGLQDGLEIMALSDALSVPSLWLRPWLQPSNSPIDNLNLSFATDGALIRVGRGVKARLPVLVHSHAKGAMTHTRSVIVLEENAELTLIEYEVSDTAVPSFSTAHRNLIIGEGARLTHIRVSPPSGKAIHVNEDCLEVEANGTYQGVMLTAGSLLTRHALQATLRGDAANFQLACAYAVAEDQLCDHSLEIRHEAPNTTSRILTKGIASSGGKGVVQGRVAVDRLAQRTDSHQLARGLLLTDGAEIFHRPELEIYADDVKCGHGATIGALDAMQLFYLRSRGIPEADARQMLISAYFAEVVSHAPAEIRTGLEAWAEAQLATRGQGA